MLNKVRNELMKGDEWPLKGEVELDETSWGGRPGRKMGYPEAARHREGKPTILGMVERGGRIGPGMRSTYKMVSCKWLQSYLDEYAWRHNQRNRGSRSVFHLLVEEAAK